VSNPMMPFESANKTDDDGQVIDSFFIETDTPPNILNALKELNSGLREALKAPRITSRMLAGNMSFGIGLNYFAAPTMILPSDANRTSITLSVFSNAGTPGALVEYLSLADDGGKCLTSAAMNLRHGRNDPVSLSGYTGPIFVQLSPAATAAMEITWLAVTS
jgi:hypothetical protein